MITYDLSILNQKGTPMFYSDIFANRPSPGVVGRIFIGTDTYAIYRDTGSAWDQIGGSGSGITGSGTSGTLPIWTSSSALGDSSLLEGSTKITTIKDIQADGYYLSGMTLGTGALYYNSSPEDRVTLANYNVGGTVYIEVNGGNYAAKWGTDLSLTNYGYIAATPTLTAANNASSLASYGINTLSYAAGFSSNNIGALYGGMAAFNLQTFAGSATFAQANVASGDASVNSIDFSSAGSTITMTQSSGIRVMSGQQNLFQYQGTNSGTITHAAISQNTGFYRPSGASGILTITNAYSHLINALDDYGAGFSFTNRWGIYQAGASDTNYFAANMLLGTLVNNGNRLQVNGSASFTANIESQSFRLYKNGSDAIVTSFYQESISGTTYGNSMQMGVNGDNQFWNYNGAWFKRLTIDTNGNIGLGVTPSAWATYPALQIGRASYWGATDNAYVGANYYWDGSTRRYINSNFSCEYGQISGNHQWYIAPSGTAGNAITFTQAMTLNSSGELLIGSSTDYGDYKLQITGNARVGKNTGSNFNITTNQGAGSSGSPIYIDLNFLGYADNVMARIRSWDESASTGFGYLTFSTFTNTSLLECARFTNAQNFLIGSVNDVGKKLYLNGSLRIDGQRSGTAGGSSGQHLIIDCDGTTYKIALLNN